MRYYLTLSSIYFNVSFCITFWNRVCWNIFIFICGKLWQSLWIDTIWCNMYLVKYIRIWYCNNLLFSLVRCKPKYFDTQEVQAYYINSYFLRILIFFVLFIPVAWLSIFLSYPFSSFSLLGQNDNAHWEATNHIW